MKQHNERMNILLVEDNCRNVSVVRRSLAASNTRCRLQTVGAVTNTMHYLQKASPYEEAPTPDLVLFDMSDIRPESLRLLEQIKADKEVGGIPIVLLIDAESDDVLENLCVNHRDRTMFSPIALDSFLIALNSFRLDRFLNAVKLIESLGFVLVTLPQDEPAEQSAEVASKRSA